MSDSAPQSAARRPKDRKNDRRTIGLAAGGKDEEFRRTTLPT